VTLVTGSFEKVLADRGLSLAQEDELGALFRCESSLWRVAPVILERASIDLEKIFCPAPGE
jgi:hypothetical protein